MVMSEPLLTHVCGFERNSSLPGRDGQGYPEADSYAAYAATHTQYQPPQVCAVILQKPRLSDQTP